MQDGVPNRVLEFSLLLVGPCLVLVGYILHDSHQLLGPGIEHLGIGLFAIMILRVVIEKAQENEFLKLLRKDVKGEFSNSVNSLKEGVRDQLTSSVISLITRHSWILQDKPLRDELERSVLAPIFVRPSYNLDLTLARSRADTNVLRVDVDISYEVENVSDVDQPYTAECWLDDLISLKSTEDVPGFNKVSIGGTDLNIQAMVDRGSSGGAGNGLIVRGEHMISLRNLKTPSSIKPGEKVAIIIGGTQLMRTEDHFVWNLPTLTKKLTISIHLKGDLTFELLDLAPREMHHIAHEDFLSSRKWPSSSECTLTIDEVLLPFQGVELRWVLKDRA